MPYRPTVIEAIGDTPLIKLRAASEATGCTILGKAEFMNPGGSVKDRAALAIIRDAVASGALRPGGVIVEGTAGNTGIGIGMVASALGFRTVIVIPDTQAQEKKDMLRLVGAELVEVPAVPYSNPNNYVKYSGRLAEALAKTEPNGAIWANQFDNVANRRGHYETTGPEIYDATEGKVDGFVSAVGSGGTLAGVGMALKERDPRIKIALADPFGAALYAYYTHGVLKSEGSSITEGIGQGRITANLEGAPVDFAYQIPDEEAVRDRVRSRRARGPAARRLVGDQHRRRDPARARTRPRPHDRHHPLRLRARATPPSCSTRLSCARRTSPSRPGSSARASAPKVFLHDRAAVSRRLLSARARSARRRGAGPRASSLDATIFYARGGGQSGDRGRLALRRRRRRIDIVDTIYDADRRTILHVPAEGARLPAAGERVVARTRLGPALSQRMRAHTALHLLTVVLPYPVTGGSVGDGEGRLDFDSGEAALDKAEIERAPQRADRDQRRSRARAGSATRSSPPIPAWSRPCRSSRRPAPAACASSRSSVSTCSPAAAPMSRAPARSAAPRSPASRRRAGSTGGCASRSQAP